MLHYTDAQFKGRERAVTTWWSRAGRMELVIPHPERLLRVDRHIAALISPDGSSRPS